MSGDSDKQPLSDNETRLYDSQDPALRDTPRPSNAQEGPAAIPEMQTLGYQQNQNLDDFPINDVQRGDVTINQLLSEKHLGNGVSLDDVPEQSYSELLLNDKPVHYSIGSMLAKGGMGLILNAKDLNCRREVAMKVIGDSKKAAKDQLLRFIIEAQITAQLQHPSIVPVYELSVDVNGDVFYTMKLVNGYTLVELIDRIRSEDDEFVKKYSLVRLLNIFTKVCEAVAYAHSRGVIHRDLKPDNIMIGDFGEVLLMDWGLAKVIKHKKKKADGEEDSDDSDVAIDFDGIESILTQTGAKVKLHTMSGQIMGTPGFMAPEQALGKVGEINEKSDVYALGGILYNILTLRDTITGSTIRKIVQQIVAGDITPPVDFNKENSFPHCPGNKIPEVLSSIAMKALETEPEDRYQSVQDLENDLQQYLGGFATSVEDDSFFYLLKLMIIRNKTEFVWGVVVCALMLSITTGFVVKIVEAKNLAEENLNKFLQEQSVRKDVSERLLNNAIDDIKLRNSHIETLNYEISLIGNEFALALQDNRELTDISPLKGLPLVKLNLSGTKTGSISSLSGMQLTWLSLAGTNVSDLSPLSSSNLTYLDLSNTKIKDLNPLLSLPLKTLIIAGIPKLDISKLMTLPLKRLTIDRYQTSYADVLKQMNLEHISVKNAANKSIQVLSTLTVSSLDLEGRDVTDLSALRGMNITSLTLDSTKVRDLDDLSRLPLNSLRIYNGLVRDISGLKTLKLTELRLEKCYFLNDLEPLADCHQLDKLLIPPHVTEIDFLKDLSGLKVLANNINDYNRNQTPEEFWEKFSKQAIEE